MRNVTFAATQFACSWDKPANVAKAKTLVRDAATKGANVDPDPGIVRDAVFLPGPVADHFALAAPFEGNPLIAEMAALAKELGVVLPVSFFEKAGHAHFNSLAMVDADGRVLGLYRKSHIPDGPGYQEKYLFHARRHRLQGLEDEVRHDRRGHLLGPVVSGKRARDGADGRGGAVLSDRHRQRAAARAAGRQPRSLAPRDAGPCRREHDAADRLATASARRRGRRAR